MIHQSGHGWVPHKAAVSVLIRAGFSTGEGSASKLTWLLASLSSLWAVGLKASVFCWLSARGLPSCLHAVLSIGQLNKASCIFRASKWQSFLARWTLQSYVITYRSILFVIFCGLEVSHRSYPHLRRENYIRTRISRDGDHGSHFRVCHKGSLADWKQSDDVNCTLCWGSCLKLVLCIILRQSGDLLM